MPLIVYEDEDLLVLNKPSGMPSVPHSATEAGTAVGLALKHYPALEGVGRFALEPGLLHRLDTGTSGLLAFAKSQAEYERLRALWKSGEVVKTYRALLEGAPTFPLPRDVRLTLAHHPKSAKRMIALIPGKKISHRGKPLPTITRLVRMHGERDIEIIIQTGVMHQIRCTLAHLGHSVIGDPIYGKIAAPRLMLHAWKLEIPSPDGRRLTIEAPVPRDFSSDEVIFC